MITNADLDDWEYRAKVFEGAAFDWRAEHVIVPALIAEVRRLRAKLSLPRPDDVRGILAWRAEEMGFDALRAEVEQDPGDWNICIPRPGNIERVPYATVLAILGELEAEARAKETP